MALHINFYPISGVVAALDEESANYIKAVVDQFNARGGLQIKAWHYWEKEPAIIIKGFLHVVRCDTIEPNRTLSDIFRMNNLPNDTKYFDIITWRQKKQGIYLEFESRSLLLSKLSNLKALRTPTGFLRIKKRIRRQLSKAEVIKKKYENMDLS